MTTFGVDVSAGQGTIDWAKVKASGIRFGIARCVREGDLGVDASYARNVAGMRANGITPGAYCYLSGSGRAATQASLFIRTIGDPTGMLIALDVEKGALTPTAADVRTFAAAWHAVWPKHPLLIYGSRGATLGGLGTLADLGPLWLAAYPRTDHASAADLYTLSGGAKASQWASTFGGWKGPAIWQYGSTGVLPGISGSVDLDAIETADLAALTGENTTAGDPPMRSFGRPDPIGLAHLVGPGTAIVPLGGEPWDGPWPAGVTWSVYDDTQAFDVPLPGGIAGEDRASFLMVRPDVTHDGKPWPYAKPAALLKKNTDWPAGKLVSPVAPDTSPFTQADIDAKVKAAVDADRKLAHITWQ
jgi:lysozyme